ncbi:hypothetical protein ACHAWT_003160 [Skeletonema menzelii]|mmetsp:Transcript_15638/g.25704  ORF Transcript_15638/g.25704 Transcript_15638/m.25704 type:complete len:209 (-) Transcript_15638:174-800(-)|eukprot:scaffold26630_cov145-Skeletonema_menzelii.AAC.4
MGDAECSPTMSIKDRIAALQKGKGAETAIPIGPPPTKPKKSNALAGRIAALQLQSVTEKESSDNRPDDVPSRKEGNKASSTKVGKLKLPPEGIPIIMPGAGPPPSLVKKQREREERKQKMIADAQKEDLEWARNSSTTATSSVSKVTLPPGAIKVMVPECPPPAMMSSKADGGAVEEENSDKASAATSDDAVMSRPTMPKRRPRNRGD